MNENSTPENQIRPESRDYAFAVIAGIQLGICALIIAMFFSPTLQHAWMNNMHLSNNSWWKWATIQIIPKMYSFDNTIAFEYRDDELAHHFVERRLNHYPPRFLTFNPIVRRDIKSLQQPPYLEMRSRFHDTCRLGRYEWEIIGTHNEPRLMLIWTNAEHLTCN